MTDADYLAAIARIRTAFEEHNASAFQTVGVQADCLAVALELGRRIERDRDNADLEEAMVRHISRVRGRISEQNH